MFEFARQVRDGAAWLVGVHPSSLAAVLNRAGVTPARWTARDLLKHLSVELKHHASVAKARGESATAWRFMDAHETRNALAYTRWLLAEFIDPEQSTPTEDAAQQAAEGWRGRVDQAPAAPVAVSQEFAGAQAAAARAIARQAKLDAQFAARAEAAAARARAEADAEQSALILAELRAKYPRRPRHI